MLFQCSGRAVTFLSVIFIYLKREVLKLWFFFFFFPTICVVFQNGLGNYLNQNIHVSQTSSFWILSLNLTLSRSCYSLQALN